MVSMLISYFTAVEDWLKNERNIKGVSIWLPELKSVLAEKEIHLSFKCHLWMASLIPTTCITTNVFKSIRTLWPDTRNSKMP